MQQARAAQPKPSLRQAPPQRHSSYSCELEICTAIRAVRHKLCTQCVADGRFISQCSFTWAARLGAMVSAVTVRLEPPFQPRRLRPSRVYEGKGAGSEIGCPEKC